MRGEAEVACAWADACNQNIETVRFCVGLRRDCTLVLDDSPRGEMTPQGVSEP